MKQLLVMRHAKSDWHSGAATDHARPINQRGVDAATAMGRLLTSAGLVPDAILASSAVRARTTAELAAEAGGWDVGVDAVDALYDASVDRVLARLALVPDAVDRLLVVGHQPTWGALVWRLTGGSVAMRTATVAALDLHLGDTWDPADVGGPGELTGEILAVFQPRHFGDT
ncbi:SixA phosphatase family protein [Salsipaludibacter albus]|uniref:SixA phosphatase family protein n=1 Tax=Salsipaludibacter albus TaxID=2849650 RepID=UPI001EE47BDC|nr:histidine phosphatase family protein [Salsipaludibacter albus]